jgi:phosphatidylglycerophosphate synthase
VTTLVRAAKPGWQGLAVSAAGLLVLLGALAATVGLGTFGLLVGTGCGGVLLAAVALGHARVGASGLGPGDRVTLSRATLACAVAGLVADSFLREASVAAVVALAAVALTLDAVDGPVARRSATTSTFGARFDGEADAFLLLVLSVYVARSAGAWALAIGAARYVFWAAGRVRPWMAEHLPFRYWRKVVTAVQGVVLVTAAADVVAPGPRDAALVLALALLAESFGRDVVWLWRRRPSSSPVSAVPAQGAPVP